MSVISKNMKTISFLERTVEPDDPPSLQRKMFPYKEAEKFEKLWLPSCVSPDRHLKFSHV